MPALLTGCVRSLKLCHLTTPKRKFGAGQCWMQPKSCARLHSSSTTQRPSSAPSRESKSRNLHGQPVNWYLSPCLSHTWRDPDPIANSRHCEQRHCPGHTRPSFIPSKGPSSFDPSVKQAVFRQPIKPHHQPPLCLLRLDDFLLPPRANRCTARIAEKLSVADGLARTVVVPFRAAHACIDDG